MNTRAASSNGPRIALSGSAGTGKSSLGRVLAEHLGVPYIEERMRLRLEGGLRLGELSPPAWRGLMHELWAEHAAEEARCTGGFVADRSSLDFFAFWLHYGLFDDEAETAAMLGTLRTHAETYDHILLFPWGVLPLEDDGVRATNPWLQLRFQTLLEGVLERWAPEGSVQPIADTTDFEDRMRGVIETLEG